MPLALEPDQKFHIVLASDKDKENPPCFIYRYLTGRQWREVTRVQDDLDRMDKEGTGSSDEVADKVYEAAKIGLIGWENMIDPIKGEDITFDPERLEDVVGIIEMQELILRIMQQHPSTSDKKKLDSQSESSTEKSAPTVKGLSDVEINPQQ